MNTPYTSSLLNEPASPNHYAPTMPSQAFNAQVSSVPQNFYPQPAMPQYVMAAPQSNKLETVMLAFIVLLLAAGATLAGFAYAQNTAPTAQEISRFQSIAARDGFYSGRTSGYTTGRNQGLAEQQTIARLKGLIAKQKAYNNGYRKGRQTGMNRPRPTYANYGYGGGCRTWDCGRSPRVSSWGGGSYSSNIAVNNALADAQNIANATGQAVDVEIY